MIQRILLAINDPMRFRTIARWTIELAASCSAHLLVVYFLPDGNLMANISQTELKNKKIRKNSSQEEIAWQVLYHIEDEAFEQNVRISLIIETGEQFERLKELCNSYQIDLLVVSAESSQNVEKLIQYSPKPVIFFKSDKEV
jgi:nucleotide-binding universal stress UspA family protein